MGAVQQWLQIVNLLQQGSFRKQGVLLCVVTLHKHTELHLMLKIRYTKQKTRVCDINKPFCSYLQGWTLVSWHQAEWCGQWTGGPGTLSGPQLYDTIMYNRLKGQVQLLYSHISNLKKWLIFKLRCCCDLCKKQKLFMLTGFLTWKLFQIQKFVPFSPFLKAITWWQMEKLMDGWKRNLTGK